MEFTIGTPALLFPAISLLMLAFTNRFLAVAAVIRALHGTYRSAPDARIIVQVKNLRYRAHLLRWMQFFAILSILVDVASMGLLFSGHADLAKAAFGLSLGLMMASLSVSAREIHISMQAIDLHVHDMLGEQDGAA